MNSIIKSILLLLLVYACTGDNDNNKMVKIYMIGNSTMADKEDIENNPERGWGQMLQLFFNDHVKVENHAVNGRSSKSFIDEGRWDNIFNQLQPGDYVFIQFGHNDQKMNDPKRYANPYTAYRSNLERYVNDTREKGAYPVLFSSIIRRHFNEYGTLIDTHGAYPMVAREVAKEKDVPFIDLQLMTERLVDSLGQDKSRELYLFLEPGEFAMYPDGKQDSTHLSIRGATTVAHLAVQGLKELKHPLTKYLKDQKDASYFPEKSKNKVSDFERAFQ